MLVLVPGERYPKGPTGDFVVVSFGDRNRLTTAIPSCSRRRTEQDEGDRIGDDEIPIAGQNFR